MTIKEEAQELATLLGANSPSQAIVPQNQDIVDETPEELVPEPAFTFNYEKEKKYFKKKARESIKKIVRAVIHDAEFVDKSFIADKIEQDAEQLANLYYQQRKTEVMQESNMESVRTGNISPRMYETFNMLGKNLMDIAKQISEFEISIKDNYAKIKFDSIDDGPNPMLLANENEQLAITSETNVFKNTKEVNASLREQRKKRLMENKAKEADFKEVEDD